MGRRGYQISEIFSGIRPQELTWRRIPDKFTTIAERPVTEGCPPRTNPMPDAFRSYLAKLPLFGRLESRDLDNAPARRYRRSDLSLRSRSAGRARARDCVGRAQIISGPEERKETDWEIVASVLGGDRNAFETLVHRYEAHVEKIVSKHVSHEALDEVMHDTFIRAFRSLRTFDNRAPFEHWISKIALRASYAHIRELYELRGRRNEISESDAGSRAVQRFQAQESRSEASEVISKMLAQLPPEDRMIISLIHLEERPVSDVAEVLGWSKSRVKVRAYRCRKLLRKMIEELNHD